MKYQEVIQNMAYRIQVKFTENANKFRQSALIYQTNGYYTHIPKGTTEYRKFWDEEYRRCLFGFSSEDGDYITGYFYFYLNYCPIIRTVTKEIKMPNGRIQEAVRRVRDFPLFYDYDRTYFDAIDEAERQGKHLAVIKKRGAGYEQPYSEIIITPSGEKTMGSLKVGDWVMNPAGYSVEIDEIVEKGMQDVYLVELQDGRQVHCGENHLWPLFDRRHKLVIKSTCELMNLKLLQGSKGKEGYGYHLPEINEIEFGKKIINIDPYVLGVLLGDGDLHGSQVNFSSNDKEIVDELSKRLSLEYVIKKQNSCPFKYSIVSLTKGINKLNRELKRLNLKTTSYYKFIPDKYKYSTIEDRYELVRGLLDTDGSITNGSVRFSSTSEKLTDDLAYVLRSLGIRCRKSNIQKVDGKTKFPNGYESETKPFWVLVITTDKEVFKLSRKKNKIKKESYYNRDRVAIKKITKLNYKEKQRCIVVKNENHLYLTRDFIPTHNSFKNASMLCRNFYLIPESKSYAIAGENEFLVKDGILTKAWDLMDFINEHTPWSKKCQKIDQRMHKRASIVINKDGVQTEIGYKSEIIGVSLKNDANKNRGKRGKLLLYEEAGKLPVLKTAWQIARSSVEDSGIAFGIQVAFGTGGSSDSDFTGLKDIFYEPKAYNCLAIENIWDEENYGGECGFFVPEYYNMTGVYEGEDPEYYGQPFMDKDGNSNIPLSKKFALEERKKISDHASDSTSVDRYIAEKPFSPSEACLNIKGNIFPKADLIRHLATIRNSKKLSGFKQVGELVYSEGKVKWQLNPKLKDLTKYRLDPDQDKTGAIVIWEHPSEDPPYGLYILGADPYDFDQSTTTSLGSVIVYKRFQNFESYYDLPVAEYSGRPSTAEEFYENVYRLVKYYNGKLLYENEKKGLYVYFTQKHEEYWLADQPDIINDILQGTTKVNRKKGIHMNKEIKLWGERLIRDWLNDEYAPGYKNLTKIFSEPLLEELISYSEDANADRVMAFMMIMIYKEELHHVHVKEKKDFDKSRWLFSEPLFKKLEKIGWV